MNISTISHIKELSAYQKPYFSIEKVYITVDLDELETRVTTELKLKRIMFNSEPLILEGEGLELIAIKLNNSLLAQEEYQIIRGSTQASQLIVHTSLNKFTLEIKTRIFPKKNGSLQGLYASNNIYCTQCEAEGFRKITYYLDRPDILAIFTTKIIANKENYPILLSNGNLIEEGFIGEERHYKIYHDPYPKPSYLFALVAGNLALRQDTFITQSKQKIMLSFYTEKGEEEKTLFAIEALKKAMYWDEENYKREYDLQDYKVVAIHDFNMGAMENKGLNIFNTKYILADAKIATDSDYQHIESVIAHEYFHNWTGNRITCRDWFQLSLKEGLTVFREQQFCADQGLEGFKRVQDVELIYSRQFPEDSGPMSHPVQPQSYLEINNFYTMTIYLKGAEVIRMLSLLLGSQGFSKGMSYYFDNYDGQAVTIHDFISSFEQTNHMDLTQFKLWYTQSGTPEISIQSSYDDKEKKYTLILEQYTAPTADQSEKKPLMIPIELTLRDKNGTCLHSEVVLLEKCSKTVQFDNMTENPIPSFLGNFSAPVKVKYHYTPVELAHIIQYETSGVVRWNAARNFYVYIVRNNLDGLNVLIEVFKKLIQRIISEIENYSYNENRLYDYALEAELFSVPDLQYFITQEDFFDLDFTLSQIKLIKRKLATALSKEIEALFFKIASVKMPDYQSEQKDAYLLSYFQGLRALKNKTLSYLTLSLSLGVGSEKNYIHVQTQYEQAENMTETMGALQAIQSIDCSLRIALFQDFYEKWKQEPLVLNKWLMLEATSDLPNTFDRVKYLAMHSDFQFNNPNQIYALIGSFTQRNWSQFYQRSSEPYLWLAEIILKLDKENPQVSARMTEALLIKEKIDEERKMYITQALCIIKNEKKLSNDLIEIINKALK